MRKTKLKVILLALITIVGLFFIFIPKAEAATLSYGYQLTYQSPYPANLTPGDTTNVWIEVKNTGNVSWFNNGSNIVRLGSGSSYGNINQKRDYNSEFANYDWPSNNRAAVVSKSEVKPGDVTRFQFNIKAPSTPGVYRAYFTPVVDGYSWMGDIGIYWQITVAGPNNSTTEVRAAPINNGTVANTQGQALYQTNDLVNEFAPSVVKIISKASPRYWNQGSGTLYHNTDHDPRFPKYYIMTNRHVVETDDGSVSNSDIRLYPKYGDTSNYLVFEARGYKTYGQDLDFAIIEPIINPARANAGSIRELSSYAREDAEVVKKESLETATGEKMIVLGYPENGDEAFAEGYAIGYEYYQGVRYIDTSALVRHGNSGGLAINDRGDILGIPTFVRGAIGMILDIHFAMNQIL